MTGGCAYDPTVILGATSRRCSVAGKDGPESTGLVCRVVPSREWRGGITGRRELKDEGGGAALGLCERERAAEGLSPRAASRSPLAVRRPQLVVVTSGERLRGAQRVAPCGLLDVLGSGQRSGHGSVTAMTFRSWLTRLLAVLAMVATAEDPAMADNERTRELRLQLYSADLCRGMPPALNPFGERCVTEVDKRFKGCFDIHKADSPAFEECLGFRKPPPIPLRLTVQAATLQKFAFAQCTEMPEITRPANCAAEVEKRFVRCAVPYLQHESQARAFLACLGFGIPSE